MTNSLDVASEIESFARAFELSRAASVEARVEDFFPPLCHPAFAEISLELLRIDLEMLWQRQCPRPLEEYRRCFPGILDNSERFERLAFEDYRQCSSAGHAASPNEYARRYCVDVTSWPDCSSCDSIENPFPRVHGKPVGSTPPTRRDIGGDSFDGFELIEELGRGSFGRVFLANQAALANRLVVLKISRSRTVEPDRLAQLQHANIVPIYSLHQVDELQAICMPYLGRSTLAQVICQTRRAGSPPRTGRELLSSFVANNNSITSPTLEYCQRSRIGAPSLPLTVSIRERFEQASYVDAVVWIIARLAGGLAHAHERGILHRDLKPANVLLSDDGRPMILDFNLSDQIANSRVGAVAGGGTLPYMSPEQLESLLSGAALDVRSDIYSLGVILFELLTGQLPFQLPADSTPVAVSAAIAARQHALCSVKLLNPDTPASIAAVVARCLAPMPAERYQTADQLREDLDRHLQHRPLAHAPDRAACERIQKWIRRHPRSCAAASIGCIAALTTALIAGAWLLRERHYSRVEANNHFQHFFQQAQEARLPLSLPGVDADAFAVGAAQAQALLDEFGVMENANWRQLNSYALLNDKDQQLLDREVLGLLHTLSASLLKQAAAEPTAANRNALLQKSHWFHSVATTLANERIPKAKAALAAQAQLIKRFGDDRDLPTPSELVDTTAALPGLEAAAINLLQQGRYSDAIPALIKWRDQTPVNLSAWILLGTAYGGIGNAVEAETCFTTCTRLQPQFAFSYFQRGLARLQQQKYAKAAADFSRYMELRGTGPAALINRALAHHALNKNDAAFRDLNAALAARALQTRVYFIRAAVRREMKDEAGARDDFQRGLSLTPTDAVSWLSRGMAQLEKHPERALNDFRRAMQLEPGNRSAAQNILHLMCDRFHRYDEALEIVEILLTANRRDARALLTRAVLRARQGDDAGAAADANAALKIDDRPVAALQAACAFAQLSGTHPKYRERALQLVARSIGAQPELAAIAAKDSDLAPIRSSEEFQQILGVAHFVHRGAASEQGATIAP